MPFGAAHAHTKGPLSQDVAVAVLEQLEQSYHAILYKWTGIAKHLMHDIVPIWHSTFAGMLPEPMIGFTFMPSLDLAKAQIFMRIKFNTMSLCQHVIDNVSV